MYHDSQSISKFLSYVLRHKPESIGITLDAEGWADLPALIEGAKGAGYTLDEAMIAQVVASNDKKRFALSDDHQLIRAVQGHSCSTVDIAFSSQPAPDCLYHGTAVRFLDAIREQGLKPGSRQYVHLSREPATALNVGKRYGKPVLLRVDTLAMQQQHFEFFLAENGVWLTRSVPPQFLLFPDGLDAAVSF